MEIVMTIRSLFFISAISLLAACGGDLGRDKHVIGPFEVVEVGACSDQVWGCTSKVKYGDRFYYAKTSTPTMVGMNVYRTCWTESDGRHCFVHYVENPRSIYLKGGVRNP